MNIAAKATLSRVNGLLVWLIVASLFLAAVLVAVHYERWAELLVSVAGTFISAWAGGWAAFRAERETRAEAERNARISSANKAIFALAMMFNMFENLRQFYIDREGARTNPMKAIVMDSPQPGMLQPVRIDHDSLAFLLDQAGDECSMALAGLRMLDWRQQVALSTVETRAAASSELRQSMKERPVANWTPETLPNLYPAEYGRLASLTDQFVEQVDESINAIREAEVALQRALQTIFPGQSFVQVRFGQAAEAAAN